MNATQIAKRVLAIALLATAAFAVVATQANAQQIHRLQRPVANGLPKLGFYGQIVYGQGLLVKNVGWATEAARIGLEPGDVIVTVNNQPIRNWNDYNAAMFYSGGSGQLLVRDARTGWLVPVNFMLNNGQGPSGHAFQRP